jgi:hypothetical protein
MAPSPEGIGIRAQSESEALHFLRGHLYNPPRSVESEATGLKRRLAEAMGAPWLIDDGWQKIINRVRKMKEKSGSSPGNKQ